MNRQRRIAGFEPEAEEDLRGRMDLLQCRIGLLQGEDRVLMEMYKDKGATFGQIARLMGVNEETISRRIRKIGRRLLDGEYITCLQNRERFTAGQMRIARDYFLTGMSLREIAEKHGRSWYGIRQAVMKILRIVDIDKLRKL